MASGRWYCHLMTPREEAWLSTREGPVFVAWEICDRWLKWWREENPDDGRDDLELINQVYPWQGEGRTDAEHDHNDVRHDPGEGHGFTL